MKETLTIRGRFYLSKFVVLAAVVFLSLVAIFRTWLTHKTKVKSETQCSLKPSQHP